jgi:hypothetical protein
VLTGKIRKEAVVVYFEVQVQYLLGGTVKNQEKL